MVQVQFALSLLNDFIMSSIFSWTFEWLVIEDGDLTLDNFVFLWLTNSASFYDLSYKLLLTLLGATLLFRTNLNEALTFELPELVFNSSDKQ